MKTKTVTILISTTLFLILHSYLKTTNEFLDYFIFLFLFPLVIVLIFNIKPKEFGWNFKEKKKILKSVLWSLPLLAIVFIIYSLFVSPSEYIHADPLNFTTFINFLSIFFIWELFFRGFLLFGLKEEFGEYSIIIQAIPFALMHIGKQFPETVISLFGGIILGKFAYESNSFLPAFLIHLLFAYSYMLVVSL